MDARVVRSTEVDGTLWLEVEVLGPGRCETIRPPPIATGWVPALTADGQPTAGFYARGC